MVKYINSGVGQVNNGLVIQINSSVNNNTWKWWCVDINSNIYKWYK